MINGGEAKNVSTVKCDPVLFSICFSKKVKITIHAKLIFQTGCVFFHSPRACTEYAIPKAFEYRFIKSQRALFCPSPFNLAVSCVHLYSSTELKVQFHLTSLRSTLLLSPKQRHLPKAKIEDERNKQTKNVFMCFATLPEHYRNEFAISFSFLSSFVRLSLYCFAKTIKITLSEQKYNGFVFRFYFVFFFEIIFVTQTPKSRHWFLGGM